MKKVLALILILFACSEKKVSKRSDCVQVEQVNVPAACYQAAEGLVLTADTPTSQALDWVIAPLADTSGKQSYAPYYVSTPSNQLVLPDTLVRKYPKFGVVYVGAYECGSDMYFSFVRRTDKALNCERWYLQERFVKGD